MLTMSEALRLYLDQRRIEGYSVHTIANYRYQLGRLIINTGDKPVDQLALADLRAHLVKFEGRKPATMALWVRLIKVFTRWMYEEGYVTKDPGIKLREPKLPQRVPKALNVDELESVRESCKDTREHALVEFLFSTGCRAGEIARIKRADIDWDRKALVVLGKGSKEREVYLGAKAARWLRRYLSERKDDSPWLFTTAKGQVNQLTGKQVWWVITQVAKRCNMHHRLHPHVLRHTLGTSLLNQGAPIVAVQSILGHESPETTQIYAILSGAARQQAFQRHFIQ